MEPVATYKRKLWQLAIDQYGFVTTRQARHIGVPVIELAKLAHRGVLSNVAYGLYRMNDVLPTERDEFMAAVLRVGEEAYLMGESTLALYELASVNPRSVWVGTPRPTRAKHPPWLNVVKRNLPAEDLTVFEAIPTVTVKRALLDCRGRVMTERLLDAAGRAVAEGLVLVRDRDELFTALRGGEDGGSSDRLGQQSPQRARQPRLGAPIGRLTTENEATPDGIENHFATSGTPGGAMFPLLDGTDRHRAQPSPHAA